MNLYNYNPLSDVFRRDLFSNPIEDMFGTQMMIDPFSNLSQSQSNQAVARNQEHSYQSKINYDEQGNPKREVLHTTVSSVNDRGNKIVEKEKRYINDASGEEKVSRERIIGNKAHKVLTLKSKDKPEETRTYLKGLNEDDLPEFNRLYEEKRNKTNLPQISSQTQSTRPRSELEREFEQGMHGGYKLAGQQQQQPQLQQQQQQQFQQGQQGQEGYKLACSSNPQQETHRTSQQKSKRSELEREFETS